MVDFRIALQAPAGRQVCRNASDPTSEAPAGRQVYRCDICNCPIQIVLNICSFLRQRLGLFQLQGACPYVIYPDKFQSRNRESSNFNCSLSKLCILEHNSFNLVIENLLISTFGYNFGSVESDQFQSRNRESSNFNFRGIGQHTPSDRNRFNLVIENLLISTREKETERCFLTYSFQSRNRESSNFNLDVNHALTWISSRFNLVIENLLISTWH